MKIQLTNVINFVCSNYVDREHVMHSKSGTTKFMPYVNSNEIVGDLFELLL